jgi:ech hydrogenase subunit D
MGSGVDATQAAGVQREEQSIAVVGGAELVEAVRSLRAAGHRLVQICCTKIETGYELTYSFDKDRRYSSLRVLLAEGEEMPSASGVFWAAFAYENEIHDLFGIRFQGLAVDYHGTFYRMRVEHPFRGSP